MHMYSNLGCGTGKYLSTNPHVFKVGVDRCLRLTEIARSQDSEVRILISNIFVKFLEFTEFLFNL